MSKIAPIAKAVYGGITATAGTFLVALIPYLQNGETFAEIPTLGWVTAVVAACALGGSTGGVVYQTTNRTI